MNNKKIFSANKIAFLKSFGCNQYKKGIAEEEYTKVFFVFPDDEQVGLALKEYADPQTSEAKTIKRFMKNYRQTREEMDKFKT